MIIVLSAPKAKKARRPNGQRAFLMAGVMGLEPTAFAVTGRRCNQLNYTPAIEMSLQGIQSRGVCKAPTRSFQGGLC